MYEITLSPQTCVADRAVATVEPRLFDEVDLELSERGKPWSPADPPLADISDSKLTDLPLTTEPPSPAAPSWADAVHPDGVQQDCAISECTPGSDDMPVKPQDDAVLTDDTSPAAAIPAAPRETLELTPCRLEPSIQLPTAASSVTQSQSLAASVMSPLPSPTGSRPTICKSSSVPKRIGSGRLVPARLTWKPRDPFAVDAKPRVDHFRWDVMLTSACITAVFGLGCVWLLRTLLA